MRSSTGALQPRHPFRSIVAGFPRTFEQRAIADHLNRETAKIDTAIERLREYRDALITAAVTGKIDVRGAAAA